MHSEALQDHCEQDDKGDDMTQVLIDRATLELVLRTLNRLRYDNDSVMAEEGFHEAAEALRAALANAEPTIKRYVPTDIDAEVAAGTLVQTGPMEWRKP